MESEKVVEEVRSLLTGMFRDLKEIQAMILVFDGRGIGALPVGPLTGNKDLVASMIDKVRQENDLVFFATEIWTVVRGPDEVRGRVVPSECDDREEQVMMMVYEGDSMTMHTASIIRSGGLVELGEWTVNETEKINGRFCNPRQPDPRLN